ncbi:hypothetical protein ACFFGH_13825 [Lysobacter korlensis]|uniref:Uncharacterized protein n=1 Tax=Lysobacter korlensis TaxID=553636 RepID=A0ABV6RPJ8_9GAMM
MAEIHIEKKRNNSLWIALVIVALILLAIWALWEVFDDDEVVAPVPVAEIAPAAAVAAPATQPINAPVVNGQPVSITAHVVDVPTDRVFIVNEGGRRMAVVVEQSPHMEQAVNVSDGQVVRFSGTYYNTDEFAKIEGGLEAQAQQIVRDQPGVVLVKASAINVVEAAPNAPNAAPIAAPAIDFVPPRVAPAPLAPELRGPYVGTFRSDSIRLVVNNDGSYVITESPAGEGRGAWSVLAEEKVLFLDPADGSQDRYFRIENSDTLTPLNPKGVQPAQMTALLRRTPAGT